VKGRDRLEDVGVDGRLILKFITNIEVEEWVQTSIGLKQGLVLESYEHGNGSLGVVTMVEFV
jgi:hypothetical protein